MKLGFHIHHYLNNDEEVSILGDYSACYNSCQERLKKKN